MITANDLKRKDLIMIEGDPYQVMEVSISVPSARGASTMVKIKVRHVINASVQDKTFKASEKFVEADVDTRDANFLYSDQDSCYFMDQQSFETLDISKKTLGDAAMYLVEDLNVKILMYQGSSVSLEFPAFVNLKVAQTDFPLQQAGSAGGGIKLATLANGLEVKVPQYIVEGEIVRVNTETGEVTGRA